MTLHFQETRARNARDTQLHERYMLLQDQIRRYDAAYYGPPDSDRFPFSDPAVPDDAVYDALKTEVRQLETSHPDLFGRYGTLSVTARIGQPDGAPQSMDVLPHLTPMLSLDNTRTEDELNTFLRRLKSALHWQEGDRELEFAAEHKLDGVSMSLRYERGTLIQASTRGDGERGQDQTSTLLRTGVPQTLPPEEIQDFPEVFEVRGEVMLPRRGFERVNLALAAQGAAPLKNPRNAAAGILSRGRQHVEELTFTAYTCGSVLPLPVQTHIQLLERLRRMGFTTTDSVLLQFPEDMVAFHADLQETRSALPYDIDGLVLKLDHLASRMEAGETGTAPRWATAYKFNEAQTTTLLEAIAVDVGKSGELAPRAVLRTVRLDGSDISSATLHNASFIEGMDLRPGDHVVIEKACGVIPKVVRRDERHPRTAAAPFRFPDRCPACDAPVLRSTSSSGQPEYHCSNDDCPRRAFRRLEFYCSNDGMDIKGLGEGILTALCSSGRVRDPADLYTLNVQDLTRTYTTDDTGTRRATGPKTAMKVVAAIQDSRTRELKHLINALALRHTGEGTSQNVANVAGTLQGLMHLSLQDLRNIRNVGEKTATSLWNELHSPRMTDLIGRLIQAGVSPAPARDTVTGGQLNDMRIVITGTLHVTRATAEAHLRRHGADIGQSVTRKTTHLVVGTDGGSKIEKATGLGIPILSEWELTQLLLDRGIEPF